MNPILQSLYARRSTRAYTVQPVDADTKRAILEAAAQAPTAGNQQLYTILDVTDPALKAKLAETCDHQAFIATAPIVLVFVADCLKWRDAYLAAGCTPRAAGVGDLLLAVTDTAIAAQNAVTAAESLGLSSCYIGDIMENCETQRELLRLPECTMPCCMLVMGYADESKRNDNKPARFALEHIVQENAYRRLSAEEWREMTAERDARQHPSIARNFDYDAWMRAFCERKYQSGFSREMSRSVAVYLRDYADTEEK